VKEVVQSCAALSSVGKENSVVLVIQFSQHEPSTLLSLIFQSTLRMVFTVVKKNNMVWVEITCGLGSSVSEKYTACVFSRLSEDGSCMFIQNSIHMI
jgi:hypothetical protein